MAIGAFFALRPGTEDHQSERAFAQAYRPVAGAWARQEVALQARAEHASARGPERLLALFRDARANTTRTRTALERLDPPSAQRPDVERFAALLAARGAALDRVIAALKTSRLEGLPTAVRDLARTSAQLQTVNRRLTKGTH